MNPAIIWYAFFMVFLAAFAYIVFKERSPKFVFYAMFGALFGYFIFDAPSVALGYYVYAERYFFFTPLGVPASVALAEGFCVAITIYMAERLPRLLALLRLEKN